MKLTTPLYALLCIALLGCASNGPVSSEADEEDEYDGRLFSWEFEVPSESSDENSEESISSDSSEPESATQSGESRKPRRVIYSAEEDEEGDRGFIIHSGEDDE